MAQVSTPYDRTPDNARGALWMLASAVALRAGNTSSRWTVTPGPVHQDWHLVEGIAAGTILVRDPPPAAMNDGARIVVKERPDEYPSSKNSEA